MQNVDGRKDVILVAYYFPPYNTIGAQRAIKIAVELIEQGNIVHVLRLDSKRYDASDIDSSWDSILAKYVEKEYLRIYEVQSFLSGYAVSRKKSNIQSLIGGTLSRVFGTNGIEWSYHLYKCIKAIKCSKSIIFTGPPFASALILLLFKKKEYNIILDYRDLWSQNPRTKSGILIRKVQKYFEKKVLKRVKMVTTVSQGCKNDLKEIYGGPIKVFENFPCEKQIADIEGQRRHIKPFNSECFNITLVGSVYKTATMIPLINALNLIDSHIRSRIFVHYYGVSENLVNTQMSKTDIKYKNYGLVNRESAVRAMLESDLLYSPVYESVEKFCHDSKINGIMTTKIFDYIVSKRPILNIAPYSADLVNMSRVHNIKSFTNFSSTEIDLISDFILELYYNKLDHVKFVYGGDVPIFKFRM